MNAVDQVAGVEGVGLACARAATAHVDGGDRTARYEDDRGARLPTAPDALMMTDPHAWDIGQRAGAERVIARSS